MRSLLPILILSICFNIRTHAQGGLFWNQYAAGNPAATGIGSALDISSITSYEGNALLQERLNADVRIKKLHGAIGAGYRYAQDRSYFQMSNPYVNYSFHWKTGENSLLAFGAGLDYSDYKYQDGNSTIYQDGYATYFFGVHYQFKGLKVGVAAEMFQYESYYGSKRMQFDLSDAYIDYTHKFGENWAVNVALHGGNSRNYGASVMARAIYKDKFWFGIQAGEGNGEGILLGVNLNNKWSLGYSISAGTETYGIYSSRYHITSQSLLLRFQLPGK